MISAPRPVPVRAATAVLLGTALLLSACSTAAEPRRTSARDTSSPSPSPSATPPPAPTVPSLLSGRRGKPDLPVIAVKVDNTAKAHPQAGLSKADVVYVEQVEGGVTRLAAVFSSTYPTYVGPVRSARITDIELLKQYGKVGLVYSGAQRKLADNLRRAQLGLVSFDDDGSGYRRAADRPPTYDVVGTFERLAQRAGKVDRPKAVGYAFGPMSAGGKRAKAFTVHYPGAQVSGSWNGKRWLLSMDGVPAQAAEGGRLGPTTFIVQFATVTGSGYYDVNGAQTPMTETVGRGRALFFRDGRVFEGGWKRANGANPTTYTIDGTEAVLAPGQLWVALIGRDRPVTIR